MQDGPIRHSDGRARSSMGQPGFGGGNSPYSFSFDSMHRSPTARHYETKGHRHRYADNDYYQNEYMYEDEDDSEEDDEDLYHPEDLYRPEERPVIYDPEPIRSKPSGPIAETK